MFARQCLRDWANDEPLQTMAYTLLVCFTCFGCSNFIPRSLPDSAMPALDGHRTVLRFVSNRSHQIQRHGSVSYRQPNRSTPDGGRRSRQENVGRIFRRARFALLAVWLFKLMPGHLSMLSLDARGRSSACFLLRRGHCDLAESIIKRSTGVKDSGRTFYGNRRRARFRSTACSHRARFCFLSDRLVIRVSLKILDRINQISGLGFF